MTGTKQILQIDIFLPNTASLIHEGGGKSKRPHRVVWFTSAEFYGFGKKVERKQKGPSPPAPDMFVICWSLHLRTRVSRVHRQPCTHTHTVHLQHTPETPDVGYSIYRRHWFDRMHLIIWVFLTPPLGPHVEIRVGAGVQSCQDIFFKRFRAVRKLTSTGFYRIVQNDLISLSVVCTVKLK